MAPSTSTPHPNRPLTGHPAPPARPPGSGRHVLAVVVGVQLAISIGFFAVMAHLVTYLRHDLGLLAGTIAVVLGVRVALQNMLFLPAGAITDAVGAARAGALACALRAAGFAVLGVIDGPAGLLGAAAVLAVGGALFHPAAQSLLAGVPPARRARGFAAYVVAGQVGAVAGPPVGLALLAGGFGLLSAAAAGAWAVGAVLFLLLPAERGAAARAGARLTGGVSAVLRDRDFRRFAMTAAPATLLADQIVTVVPLKEVGAGSTTLFFCVVAVAMAAVQPWCAAGGRGERPWVLRSGLVCAGLGYLALLAMPSGEGGHLVVLLVAAVLHGLAQGLMQSALFQTVTRCAPSGRFGVYFGLLSFVAGVAALTGGFVVGRLFDAGGGAAAMAPAGLALVAVLSAAFLRLPAASREHDGP
ncbi:MFS transporter [Nonomuraea angiospora]|uniref:MFS family permease n=1 Tax=Nonomuraea angiospora TaxID=46172 RepID=A0ABR9LPC2_9ACTN|nr:MFS transporter [Nonomuraea angiospora]MBE1582118.1 MFS family permease [Nonomuraea angiospora]